jgi:hypothetical protein
VTEKRRPKKVGVDTYLQVYEGDWTIVAKTGHRDMCCGCGLVHIIDTRVVDGKIEVRARLDKRATANARRPFKFSKD